MVRKYFTGYELYISGKEKWNRCYRSHCNGNERETVCSCRVNVFSFYIQDMPDWYPLFADPIKPDTSRIGAMVSSYHEKGTFENA